MLNPDASATIAALLLDKIKGIDVEYVGGLELGAVPLVSSVVTYSYLVNTPVNGFIVRKKAKEHGAKNTVEGLAPNETLAGKRVVIFEDVTTTGQSAVQAIEICQAQGAVVELVISVVDRGDGAKELFASKGIDFDSIFTADEFVEPTLTDEARLTGWWRKIFEYF